jgi:hypothetical protein
MRPRRLTRNRQNLGQARIVVTPEDTVLDVKRKVRISNASDSLAIAICQVASSSGVPVSSQILFYGGDELKNNEDTMQSIKLVCGGVLYIKEISEEVEASPAASIEKGFRGTMLGELAEARRNGKDKESSASPVDSKAADEVQMCADCTLKVAAPESDLCAACLSKDCNSSTRKRSASKDIVMLDEDFEEVGGKSCMQCTFLNAQDLLNCEICDSQLG